MTKRVIKGELTSFSIMNMVKVLEKCGRTKKNRTLKAAFLRFWRIFLVFAPNSDDVTGAKKASPHTNSYIID